MQITSGIVLYAIIWFIVLFVVLPLNLRTQAEAKDIVPGTPGSAPVDPQLGKKVRLVTLISLPIWGVLVAIILTGVIPFETFDLYSRFGPQSGG